MHAESNSLSVTAGALHRKPEKMAPRIVVCDREGATEFRSPAPWAGISITTDPGDWPVIDRINRTALLQLAFADLEAPAAGEKLFDQQDAHRLLDFVRSVWDHVEMLMVHCQAGLRRSPAVAAAVSRIYFGEDADWFRYGVYEPNMLAYETILNTARERNEYTEKRNPRRNRKRTGRRRR